MAGVGKTRHLFGHRRHHARVAMPGVDHGDPCGKVDIAVALYIPHLGIHRTVNVNLGHHTDAFGDRGITAGGDFGIQHGVCPFGVPDGCENMGGQ